MKVKIVACLFFLLNTFLFATYYSVSKEALGRIEPIIFSFFEMVTLLPAGICILILTRKDVSKALVKRGVLVGSWLCLALFTIAIALKYTSATSTAFFPSLNGVLAALIAWLFFRQPIGKVTWFAGSISMIGTVLLISNSSMGGWRGMSIAFLGGLFFTCYVFLADHQQQGDLAPWPLFGIELVTMAGWSMLIALLFGNCQSFHPSLPKDIWVILYVAGATTFLPTLITVLMQKYVSPVTVSFIYILEPILGAIVANLYLHEMLPVQGYLGGGLVVVGAVIHTWGSAGASVGARFISPSGASSMFSVPWRAWRPSLLAVLAAPVLIFVAGALLLYNLHGSPAVLANDLYRTVQVMPALVQQGFSVTAVLVLARVLCWLFAWTILLIMAFRATRTAISVLRRNMSMPSGEALNLDTRTLRHMGVMPYALASSKRKEVRRKSVKPLVQRRRQDRRERLTGNEGVEVQSRLINRAPTLGKRSSAQVQFVRAREIEYVE